MTLYGHGLRLLACGAAGVAAGALARIVAPPEVATVIGWDVAALSYAGRVWLALAPASAETVRSWSAIEDEGRAAMTVIAVASVAASFVAIFAMVSDKSSGAALGLAGLTILCSFALLHTVFAAHYAHRCFAGAEAKPGLDFPGGEPRFIDFAYYSFTIGMTFQTSDVDTTSSEMRALTLIHGVISFVFNTVIIASSVSLLSGLLTGN